MLVALFLIVIISIILFPYWLISAHPFPSPTGQWQVGTAKFPWQKNEKSPTEPSIIAKIWYPTDRGASVLQNHADNLNSPYLEKMGRRFSSKTSLNLFYRLIFSKFLLGRVTAVPAAINPALSPSQDNWPLILFSPGLTSINALNTFYALEFASHGFIVVSINHPGSSASTMLDDGSQIGIDPEIIEGFSHPNSLMSKLAIDQSTTISRVLDRAINLNSAEGSLLYQKIDTDKIFTAGHSLGGSASFLACCQDRRIVKAVNFDGYFYIDEIDIERSEKDFLLVIPDRSTPSENLDRPITKKSKTPSQFALMMAKDRAKIIQLADNPYFHANLLKSASHINFSDLPLILNPIFSKAFGLFGGTDGRETLAKTTTIAIDFLNH
jgi:dienelactone hydrolase